MAAGKQLPAEAVSKQQAARTVLSLKLHFATKQINSINKKWNSVAVRHFEQYQHHGLVFQLTQGPNWPELQLSILDFHSPNYCWVSLKSKNKPSFLLLIRLPCRTFSCRIWAFQWNMLGLNVGFSLRKTWQTEWEIWVWSEALEGWDRSFRVFFMALQAPQNLNPAQIVTLE